MSKYYELVIKMASKLKDIPLIGMRLILANVFWTTGMEKFSNIEGTAWWFEHSLGIPFPLLNAYMAASTEVIGAILLLLGLFTRLISIPLTIVMSIALITVHAQNGWLAIASGEWPEVAMRLGKAKELLKEHGNYEWITETGSIVVLNNGVEFVVIYMMMLFMLISVGPGKLSVDNFLWDKSK